MQLQYSANTVRLNRAKLHMQQQGVSIITCSNRPECRDNILANFFRQDFSPKELLIILNSNSMNLREWRMWTAGFPAVRVFQVDESQSQGACLNYALNYINMGYAAKFDDDDYYAPGYLREQMEVFPGSGAHVVGKSSWFIYFEDSQTLAIFNPNHENSYEEYLTGASLVIKREVFQEVKFRDFSVGEDLWFLKDCMEKGIVIYSSSRFNFVGIRRPNPESHTWQESEEQIMPRCEFVAHTTDYRPLIIR